MNSKRSKKHSGAPRRNAQIEPALLSEAALAKDWNRPEEDAAWAYLPGTTTFEKIASLGISGGKRIDIHQRRDGRLDAVQQFSAFGQPHQFE